ncbi:MAG: hypothetical protein U0V72_14795 [Cytophagales bacterium]
MILLAQTVLKAVSTNPDLFQKEYFKLIKWMSANEMKQFTAWCIQNFDLDLLTKIGIL